MSDLKEEKKSEACAKVHHVVWCMALGEQKADPPRDRLFYGGIILAAALANMGHKVSIMRSNVAKDKTQWESTFENSEVVLPKSVEEVIYTNKTDMKQAMVELGARPPGESLILHMISHGNSGSIRLLNKPV